MSKKGVIISLVVILIVICIAISSVVIKNNKKAAMMEDEDIQFEFLYKQYSKIISNVILGNVTIVFDESTFSNFITGEKYSQEHIDRLKGNEIIGNDSSEIIVISIGNYNKKDKSVNISYSDSEDTHLMLCRFDIVDGVMIKTN